MAGGLTFELSTGLLRNSLRGGESTVATFVGSFGLFLTMFGLFVRYLPMVAMAEVKGVLPQANPHHHAAAPAKKGTEEVVA